jgi:hypothetical protein
LPDKPIELNDFEQRINNMLPNGLHFKEEYLASFAVLENSQYCGTIINKLIASDLPLDLHKR